MPVCNKRVAAFSHDQDSFINNFLEITTLFAFSFFAQLMLPWKRDP